VLEREDGWARLEALGRALEQRLAPLLAGAGASLVRAGSIFWLSLAPGAPPRRADALDPATPARYRELFHGLLARGIALAPSAYEVGFLSLAHAEADLDRLANALAELLPARTR
jgi:glutamate-1-semialdehyde 2,1-aminomutase